MKMYNQPTTEVTNLKTASLMQGVVISTNPGGGGGGDAHAPVPRSVAPLVPGGSL